MIRILATAILWFLATAVSAGTPRVSVDIPPVHALVSRVMQGAGAPDLIVTPGASAHGYSPRPSQADALSDAQLVIWVGADLTPWLSKPLGTLAADAAIVDLLQVPGTVLRPFRTGPIFEQDHDDRQATGGIGQGAVDPHAWLDPANASLWLGEIARTLAELDPDNAALYVANARAGQDELTGLSDTISATVSRARSGSFVVFHDAYHYFEARFGIEALGALAPSDASAPGPARLSEIRDRLQDRDSVCVFAEPQFNPGVINSVVAGKPVQVAVLDPLGADLEPGWELYPRLLTQMAEAIADCAGT